MKRTSAPRKMAGNFDACTPAPVMIYVQATMTVDTLFTFQTSTGLYRLEGVDTGNRGVVTYQLRVPHDTQVQLSWVPNLSGAPQSETRRNALCSFRVNNMEQAIGPNLQFSMIPGTDPEPLPDVDQYALPAGAVLTWIPST